MIMSSGGPRQQSTTRTATARSLATRISVGPQTGSPHAANENEFFNRRRVRVFVAIALAAAVLSAGLALVFA